MRSPPSVLVLVVVAVALAGCGHDVAVVRPHAPVAPAPAPVALHVTYREAANAFEILDNVSGWLEDKVDVEYRAYWKERFGITGADEERFRAYERVRSKYYVQSGGTGASLFARLKPPDRIADAFYAADTVDAALAAIASFAVAEEVAVLRAFFDAYRAQLGPLLAESKAFVEVARTLELELGSAPANDFYRELARYYGADGTKRFTVLFVWWPPIDATTANQRGDVLLLKYHPTAHRDRALKSADVAVHELTHYVSAHQPEAQKLALSKTFLSRCDVTAFIPHPKILEEPLAVVHQKMFAAQVSAQSPDYSSGWYGGDPWIGTFAKLVFEQVRESHRAPRAHIDDALMTTLGKSCASLQALAAVLQRPRQ